MSFDSLSEKRSLFGYEQLWFFKIQAGIIIQAQRQDWMIRATPRSAQLAGKVFEAVDVAQEVDFYWGRSLGYVRRVKLRNAGASQLKLRVLELLDPSAAHFGSGGERWGSLGVNAFNRESHVVMDEVSDPPTARVVGSAPSPSRVYMTSNRARAQELISAGELPEATAGMSGQVLVICSYDIELPPGEGKELLFVSLYNAGKLEEVLSDFGRLLSGERQPASPRTFVACSDQAVGEAAAWAMAGAEGGAHSKNPLEMYETMRCLAFLEPAETKLLLASCRSALRKDGSLPHALDPSKPGVLETAIALRGTACYLALTQDKKLVRGTYPLVRRLAGYLMSCSKEFRIETDPSIPQGWRRSMGSGYPTGEIPEVSLAVAGALEAASQIARFVSKADDATKFRERCEMITERVRKGLLDERGFLVLCRDSSGRLRSDETVDMAVSAYRHPFHTAAEQSGVHRLMEKDFDTRYGPRCVPTTNQVYFNPAYGEGQLGGVWTRAALSHSIACYRAGLAGLGSLALTKISRLVTEDAAKLGGSPGCFPRWIDVDAGEAHGEDSDPVASARFVEAILEGELGFPAGAEKASLSPPSSSSLTWLMVSDMWAGETSSAFLGRGAGKTHLFFSGGKLEAKSGLKFSKSERLELPARGVYGITFHNPGQVVCFGNSTGSKVRVTVSFPPRAAELARRLSTPLESYDPSKETWSKEGSLRVTTNMSFEAALQPNDWKCYRVSSP